MTTHGDQGDAVVVIEKKARKDSKDTPCELYRLDADHEWQPIRLILTTETLFILIRQGHSNAMKYTIVESIPLHEIVDASKLSQLNMPVRKPGNPIIISSTMEYASVSREASDFMVGRRSSRTEQIHNKESLSLFEDEVLKLNSNSLLGNPSNSFAFQIHTKLEGFNQGKIFYFSAGSEKCRDDWLRCLDDWSLHTSDAMRNRLMVDVYQSTARAIFRSPVFQMLVILCICANFLLTIMQGQIGQDPMTCLNKKGNSTMLSSSDDLQEKFDKLDLAFTVLFTAELLFNFSAHAFWPFILNKWNLFDTAVVTISICIMFLSASTNGMIKQLRVLRIFRVIRVFGRIGQLRALVNSITKAISPALQALFIALIVVSIYATIGQNYYADDHPAGFCDFFHALYTMFCTGAWGRFPDSLIAPFDAEGNLQLGVVVFIFSYVAIVKFQLLQILIGVLLDSFGSERQRDEAEDVKASIAKARRAAATDHPLDAFLQDMAKAFDTSESAGRRLDEVLKACTDNSGGNVSFEKLASGIFKLSTIKLHYEDFERLTDSEKLCNVDREIEPQRFKVLMLREMRKSIQRELADIQCTPNMPMEMIYFINAIKIVIAELEKLYQELEILQQRVSQQSVVIKRQSFIKDQLLMQGRMITLQDAVLHKILLGIGRTPSPTTPTTPSSELPRAIDGSPNIFGVSIESEIPCVIYQ